MSFYPKLKNIDLSIFGSSGSSGIFSTRPLYLKSDINTGIQPLYLKSTPTGIGTSAQTNWDISLVSNARINNISNGDVEYNITDFSSNKYDSYYPINQGQESLSYTLSHDWSVNDLSIQEDVLVVATKDYTSFEKYTIESDAKVVAGYFDKIKYYPYSYFSEETVYDYSIYWDTFDNNSIIYTADLVITYEYAGQTIELRTLINNSKEGIISFKSTALINPETDIVWEGDSNDQSFWSSPEYTLSTEMVEYITPPPSGSILRNGAYIYPPELKPKLSRFLIPDFVQIFEDKDKTWFKFAGNTTLIDSEVPDYSDIYLKIVYDSTYGVDPKYIYQIDNSTEPRVYKFGGFIKFEDFYAGLLDRAILNEKLLINDDSEFQWYIILKDGKDAGKYYSIGLSNYVTWDFNYQTLDYSSEFTSLIYYKSDLGIVEPGSSPNSNYSHYEPLDLRYISTKWIEVVKIAGFPNCGKVDLYFPKTGMIQGIESGWNIVTSSGHNLLKGDRIKFTEVLGNNNSLKGLRYVIPVDSDRFAIYYDKDSNYPAYINGVATVAGVRWSAIDGNTWGYFTTLYSPTDKNGYGNGLKLISSYEPSNIGETPLERAVETDKVKPQAEFTGQRSWNNYYPYERFDSDNNIAFNVVNGNKFGCSTAIRKIDYRYILLVAEEGASESFDIINSYFINDQDNLKPYNHRVIPSYFPYGRLHFYIIDPTLKSVEYLTSFSPSDNPWIGYETINLQQRLTGAIKKWENLPISSNDLYEYGNIVNNYWNGARFLQWISDDDYNPSLGIEFPDQNSKLNHYGFIDRIKCADFEIFNDDIFCAYTVNSKSADFYNALRIKNLDSTVKLLNFNLNTPSIKTASSFVVNNSTFTTSDIEIQKEEYNKFGKKIKFKDGDLFFGWSSDRRGVEYIYRYSRTGSSYVLKEVIDSIGSFAFGDRFVIDDGILLSDNQLEQKIKLYKYDGVGNKYYYNSDFQIDSKILSYELLNDIFVIGNQTGYIGYRYDRGNDQFYQKFSKQTSKTIRSSVMKISASNHAAFFDSGIEYDTGSYHKSLQIIDAGNVDEYSLNTYLFTLDTHYPEYLPLFIKTLEGTSSGSINLFESGHEAYSSGMPVNLQAPMPFSGELDLFLKQIDVYSTGVSLFHKSISIQSGELPLFIYQQTQENNLALFVGSDPNNTFNLYVRNEIFRELTESEIPLYINSFTTFPTCYYHDNDLDGNIYHVMIDGNIDYECGYDGNIDGINGGPSLKTPMFLYNDQILPASSVLPLRIFAPGTGLSSSVNLWNAGEDGSGVSFNGRSLYVFGSGYKGTDSTGIFNLWVQSPTTEKLPLFVYNTVTTGYLSVSISGANWTGTGLNLAISGIHVPDETLRFYIRGDL